MEPAYFGIDSEIAFEVIGGLIFFTILIERSLSVIFEWRIVLGKIKNKGLKEPIAFITTYGVVYYYGFDAIGILFQHNESSVVGYLLTTGLIAGLSKGSTKLFRDVLGWKSSAAKEQ